MDTSTQATKILKALKRSPKSGIANYQFPRMGILRYSARIADLRKEGYNIIPERQVINGRSTGVWVYRLGESKPLPKETFADRFKHIFL